MTNLIFLISGVSGLTYQIVWVRMFGQFFGNSVFSAAFVTGIFMLGLGLGAYLGGVLADTQIQERKNTGLKLYIWAEVFIGVWGLGLSFLFPEFERISAILSTYTQSADNWFYLSTFSHTVRYIIAFLLVFPSTFAMGATLTALIRHISRFNMEYISWKIALLYGFNTVGAALACVAVDFLLIPYLGLQSTQHVAVLLNFIAVYLAQRLLKNAINAPTSPASIVSNFSAKLTSAYVSLFLSGIAGMGLEIVWFRFLSSAFGQKRTVFSILIGTILFFMWLGSSFAGWLSRKNFDPIKILIGTQAVLVVSVVLGFATFAHSTTANEFILVALPTIKVLALPAFCMGMLYPIGNSILQKEYGSVGKVAGLLYLYNTVGGIFGALGAGFIFIPLLGMQGAVLLLLSLSVVSALVFFRATHVRLWSRSSLGLTASLMLVIAASFVYWIRLPEHFLVLHSFEQRSTLAKYFQEQSLIAVDEGAQENIVVLEVPDDGEGRRRLYINGQIISASTEGAQRYMRAFSHIPLLGLDNPENVLVICFGVGNTAHAASLHESVRRIDVVDISASVLRHGKYFQKFNDNILIDPRTQVYVNDGRQHLRMVPSGTFDLITLEPPPLSFAGVESLYSYEFYKLAYSALKSGGYISHWLPIWHLPSEVSVSIIATFFSIFPNGVLLSGEVGDLIMVGRKDGSTALDIEKVMKRIEDRPKVLRDLQKNNLGTAIELAGTFVADQKHILQITRDSILIRDNFPQMEYAALFANQFRVPLKIYDEENYRRWCKNCDDYLEKEQGGSLQSYLSILKTMRHHSSYIYGEQLSPTKIPALPFSLTKEEYEKTLRSSSYLQRIATRWWPKFTVENSDTSK